MLTHRPVPPLPRCPKARSIAKEVIRSYPVGRQEFCRALAGSPMELKVSSPEPFPADVQANLLTMLNANSHGDWIDIPFERTDERTFTCRVVPQVPGLYAFRARFTRDGGATWLQDPVPDAWVLVDPPQVDHMRQYTMIPSVSGTIADWSAQLPHIKEMGFNTIHLLPLTTLDASLSPYSAKDLFSVDPGYLAEGTDRDGLQQLEDFVETAKKLDLRLCFDLVLNHVGSHSLIVQNAPDWIVPDQASPDGFRRARYFSDKGWLPWNDLVLIDYEHPSERIRADIFAYMTEYALFWGKFADYTNGYVRFDNLHSSDKTFVSSVAKSLRKEYPNLGIIAEYFTDNSTLLNTVPMWGLNLILATPWDRRFVPELRDYLKHIHSVSEHVRFFMPITSHDSGSPAQEFASAQATIPRYVAAALLGSGATGITQGVEWGDSKKTEFIGRHPRIVRTGEPKFGKFLRLVNDILATHPTFRGGQNCKFVDNHHHAVIAAFRKNKPVPHSGYLVICNFDIMGDQVFETDLSQVLDISGPITCRDLLTNQTLVFTTPKIKVLLPACAAMVLMF